MKPAAAIDRTRLSESIDALLSRSRK